MGGGETWRRESEVRPLSKRGPLSVHGRPLIRIIRFRPTLGATFIRRSCARKNASIAGGPGIYECRGHMLVERPFSRFSLFFLLPPPRLPIAKFLQKIVRPDNGRDMRNRPPELRAVTYRQVLAQRRAKLKMIKKLFCHLSKELL